MTWTAVAPQSPAQVLELFPPFPVVLVSTRSNLLTVSMVHYFSFSPLRVGVAIARARHSHSLIHDEGEFAINIPGPQMIEAVKSCGRLSGRDGDKFAATGLTAMPSIRVAAASVEGCLAHVECVVEREIGFEERTWYVGLVVAARRRDGGALGQGLMAGRHGYVLPGEMVSPR